MDNQRVSKELENFWHYHKVHVIIGILIAFCLFYFLLTSHQTKDLALNVVMFGSIKEVEQHGLEQIATNQLFGKGSSSIVKMDFWHVDQKADPTSEVYLEKLASMIETKSLDVVVLDKDSFIHGAKKGMFLKLDSLKAHLSKDTPFVKVNDDKHNYGIRIDNNPLLMDAGYNTDGKVIGILANTKHQKLSTQLIKWLFNNG